MDDRATLETLAEALLADRRDALEAYFAARGARLESLVWSPSSTVCACPQIAFLINYWQSLRNGAALPAADSISPFGMKPALGHIVLIDMIDDGWDGVFRLYGTKVAETYGADMTGRRISEIDGGNYVSLFFRALYRTASLRRESLYTHHFPPPHVAVESWQRIMLPLQDAQGRVTRFLCSNVAGPWRPPHARAGAPSPAFTTA
ncbi:MAG: PAS domain-containing protein [Ferrovibrio sp.]|jgi:hypothetical protein|uniref:PAS domain-containing protein n=1 Tax=Ferrovibrio sp. TaxID=1917215 RepID=UPI00391C17DB